MTQDLALAILKSGANVFLTGEPGSGKTHTINRYVAHLRAHGIEPALTASTGIAATHVGGMTVHSWSGIGIAWELTERDLARIASNARVGKRVMKAKVLIIDEVSMLDSRTLSMVDAVCRAVRRDGRPFGGLQTVLVGDFFQLPPVSRSERLAEFAFRSQAWAFLRPVVCYLTEQHRQDDATFLSVLGAIRSDMLDDDHLRSLQGRAGAPIGRGDAVRLFCHNVDVDRINERELAKLPGEAKAYVMRTVGTAHLVEALVRGCLSPQQLQLKIGAAVMFTRNDPQHRFVNGTLGTVIGFNATTGLPTVRTRAGATIDAEPMQWTVEDQGAVLAAVTQVPLRLAWAMTVHKSQGMSLDAAVIDLGSAFEYGQGYVALSRVRRLSGLSLLGWNERAAQVHPEILAKDREFREASDLAEERAALVPENTRRGIEHDFIVACGGREKEERGISAMAAAQEERPKAYARWTADEEKELTALFRSGTPIKEIARKLDRQRGGISSRLKKLGLVAADRA